MKWLVRAWCWISGHDMLPLYVLDNADSFDGSWRSKWGEHECLRCGKKKLWQYDR